VLTSRIAIIPADCRPLKGRLKGEPTLEENIGRGDRRLSHREREHLEFYVLTVEKERLEPLSDVEVERIVAEMQSSDPKIRARAVRRVCPCRASWDVFNRLRKAAKALQHDQNSVVAACAGYIEQDARQVAQSEARLERIVEGEELEEDRHTLVDRLAAEQRRMQRRTKSSERHSF
jgi:hypothetical protein